MLKGPLTELFTDREISGRAPRMDITRYLDTAIDLNPQGRISEDFDLVGVREFFKGHLVQTSLDSL